MKETNSCIILAAGRGIRMGQLTENTPKALLQINNKSLIQHNIDALKNNNFDDITVTTHYLEDKIKRELEINNYNVKFSDETGIVGIAGGIRQAMMKIESSDYFLVVNSDVHVPNFQYDEVHKIIQNLRSSTTHKTLAHLFLVPNPPHNANGDFCLENGLVIPKSNEIESYTFSGIAIYHTDFFRSIEPGTFANLHPLMLRAIDNAHVSGSVYDGEWYDVGTPEVLKKLNK
jgi:MurNAc alpha-1-phosphate uridylyltransferase